MELDTSQEGIEAYFDRFMAGELHGGEMIRVVTNPKFWDFLASHLTIYFRAAVADDILRSCWDMGTKHPEHVRINEKALEIAKEFLDGMCHESFQAEYARVPDGRKFKFLREWFCSSGMDEGDDEWQAMGVGKGAEKENEKSGADGRKIWEWTESDSEAEFYEGETVTAEGVMREGNGVSSTQAEMGWEWTDYDSEAELSEGETVTAEGVMREGNGVSSTQAETCWEWTDYDSEAEREEAEERKQNEKE